MECLWRMLKTKQHVRENRKSTGSHKRKPKSIKNLRNETPSSVHRTSIHPSLWLTALSANVPSCWKVLSQHIVRFWGRKRKYSRTETKENLKIQTILKTPSFGNMSKYVNRQAYSPQSHYSLSLVSMYGTPAIGRHCSRYCGYTWLMARGQGEDNKK